MMTSISVVFALMSAAPGLSASAPEIAARNAQTLALFRDGKLKIWGSNENGELGEGNSNNRGDGADEMGNNVPAVSLGSGRKATHIAAGWYHTCAVLDNSSMKCWGSSGRGQLGYGDTTKRGNETDQMGDKLPVIALGTSRTVKAIAAGDFHTCAVLDNDSMKCWGESEDGQLGLGSTEGKGDAADEMGDKLAVVNLGSGRKAKHIAAGGRHTCAVLDNSSMKCWGLNDKGQLGYGDTTTRGNATDQMGDKLPVIALGTGRTVKAITAGDFHTCAVLDNDSMKCWGWSEDGQLGLGSTEDKGDAADEMGDKLAVVNLGSGRKAKHIAAGVSHTCAVLDNSSMKCWGLNDKGQLGYNDTISRGDAANEMGDKLPVIILGSGAKVEEIVTGGKHTCAVLNNRDLKCWGHNDKGQLGRNDTADQGDDANEMGNSLKAIYSMPLPETTTTTTVATTTTANSIKGASIDAAVARHGGVATLVALGAAAVAVALQI